MSPAEVAVEAGGLCEFVTEDLDSSVRRTMFYTRYERIDDFTTVELLVSPKPQSSGFLAVLMTKTMNPSIDADARRLPSSSRARLLPKEPFVGSLNGGVSWSEGR